MGSNTNMGEAAKLLDFSQQIDLGLLDRVITVMYSGIGEEQKCAQDILTKLKDHQDAWTRVDGILEYSTNAQTKYFALQILEEVIKTRWKALPDVQCEGIKKFIVQLIIKTSSNPASLEQEKLYLNKLNMILVQILKRDWPKKWQTFITDIVGSSKTNESLCQNNMVILKLLSEEIFDFSIGNITQTKAKHLKDTMCNEFSQIFTLCQFVMDNSNNPNLINATLETLLRFLNWIPLGYIFETDLIKTLTGKFLPVPAFRNITLKCLTEIAGVTVKNYDERFAFLFTATMEQLQQMVPLSVNIRQAYGVGTDREQQFIQNLAMFLCIFLKEHGALVEKELDTKLLSNALEYLALISEVDEIEIFKICLEYWNSLSAELYRETPFVALGGGGGLTPGAGAAAAAAYMGINSRSSGGGAQLGPRRQFYAPLLSRVRQIMISRMAKPEEVLIVENENGEVVREFMKDTDSINLYKNMRESLVYLTHLDCADTERIMTKKLSNQVNGTEWSWKNLNTLCWAIGSISGAMHEEDEKRFIVTVIKDLLGLCEQKKGKDNKAIIASNIMYVVGQYPRFLRAHWKFLKTVVNKLFEFMHETHDGVQDMACDTFIKIAQKCRRHFVTVQMGEVVPFIEEILTNTSTIICDLQPQQVHTFYEAVGYMISAQTDSGVQDTLIQKYMHLPNQVWDEIIQQASVNVDVLKDMDAIKQLSSILKTNVRACKALAHPYSVQLGRIYLDMLNIYKVMSANITQAIGLNGEAVTKQPLIKGMRVIKKESLKLIQSWILRSTNNTLVLDNFIPPLLDAVLLDYKNTLVPSSREPEVLSTMAVVVNKLEGAILHQVPMIFEALFQCTLGMISNDFHEFPEHRINFYTFIQAVNSHCFQALVAIPPEQFKLVMQSIFWATKHAMRNVAELGLDILFLFLQNVQKDDNVAQAFYFNYYKDTVHNVLTVVTDTTHAAGLSMHSTILAYMFSILEMGKVTVPLDPTINSLTFVPTDNVLVIQRYVCDLLKDAFKHLTENQLNVTVLGMFQLNQNVAAFKDHVKDFLVQIKDFTGEDDSDLFLEEREKALRTAEAEKRKQQMTVPGIINPHDMPEEMQD